MIIGMICLTCPVTLIRLWLVPDYRFPAGQFEEQGRGTPNHSASPRQRNGTALCAALGSGHE